MDLNEYTLLNRPALMLLVLRQAADAPTTVAGCRDRLDRELARIGERPDVPERIIADELRDVVRHLAAAALLTMAEDGTLTLTPRGRQVLTSHPMGVDESVLMRFPEYKAFIGAFARRKTVDDPRGHRYDEGHAARQAGQALTDNPYARDSADHLAWENGWSEARDTGDRPR